jgi:hypothetical protein
MHRRIETDLGRIVASDELFAGHTLMIFGFYLTMDTLPSGEPQVGCLGPPWLLSSFRFRGHLGFPIPFTFFYPRGITPAFGSGAPHSSARGTSTLLNNALLSAHCGGPTPLKRADPLYGY